MDVLLDSDYIPALAEGDFVTGDNIYQQQALLLATTQGEWKESPLTGCGIINYVNDESPENMKSNIRRQFKADGLEVRTITYKNGILEIDAEKG